MDPVTAIGLAGTVIQLISLGIKCTRAGWRWSKKNKCGTATDLIKLNEAFQKALSAATSSSSLHPDDDLCQLAEDCKNFSSTLMNTLPKSGFITGEFSGKKLGTKKIIFMAHDLDELKDRLSSFRDRLTYCLLSSLRQFAVQSLAKQEQMVRTLKLHSDAEQNLESKVQAILEHITSTTVDSSSERWQKDLRYDMIQMIYSDQATASHLGEDTNAIILSSQTCHRLQNTVISTLKYTGMEDRRNNVSAAYAKTFQWALQQEQSEVQKWDNFAQWLVSPKQIYWITGKAGSGKSTLMKYLCNDASPVQTTGLSNTYGTRCDPFLAEWAGKKNEVVMASFYFWASESDSFRASSSTLLRYLLYQIFQRKPQIIPSVIPSRWQALSILGTHQQMGTWSDADIKSSLFLAVRNLTQAGIYVSFFIDGLDEVSGHTKELISLVHELLSIDTHVKICVASRPWVEFEAAFQSQSNLKLENLTHGDIKDYVTSHFVSHEEFGTLRRRNRAFADQLIDNIVSKASGVFLWVKLVVASLLEGMNGGDRIEDLQYRLDLLPPDLEDLYDEMLRRVDPHCHNHAAEMIMLIESARESLPLVVFSFADEESLSSLQKLPDRTTGTIDLAARLRATRLRLNNRWKGLIEVTLTSYPTCNESKTLPVVQYLHRTVKEFVHGEKASLFLNTSLKENSFDPHLKLCIAYCAELKTGEEISDTASIRHLFYHASQVSYENEIEMMIVVNHLAEIPRFKSLNLLHQAVKESSLPYIKARLRAYQDLALLNELLTVATLESALNAEVIRYLLELGSDPNRIWIKLLRRVRSATSLRALEEPSRQSVVAFVEYGASVEEGRKVCVRPLETPWGTHATVRTNNFSETFFNDLKAIEVIRKKTLIYRMSSWIRRI